MPMVVLVTIVGLLLSGLLVPVLLNQDRSTHFDATRVTSLDAAQAGIDLALGKIRNAKTSQGAGDAASLPCGPVSGTLDPGSDLKYTVTIQYFTGDPAAQPTPAPMICADGYGTYQDGTVTPSWAVVTSKGTGGGGAGASAGRTLVATYRFKMNNTNVPGGVIRIFPATSSSTAMCLDAGTATPALGAAVKLQVCSNSTPPADQQVFVYRTDLTLQLLSSVTAANANGLCLSYSSPATNVAVVFTACNALGNPPYNQQWSFNDNGALQASKTTSAADGNLASVCMDVAAQSPSTPATLQTCAGGTTNPRQAWIPAPSVGAGAAAPPQWVNFYEFGRCLDVTNADVNSTYLIDYPCKQNPYPGAVLWNQKFAGPTIPAGQASATGQIYTTNGSKYCLTSPLTNKGLVTVKTCVAGQANQTWKVYNNDDSLPYTMKFTVVDTANLCLSLTTPQGSMVWSAISVETCTGRGDQKWNADPTVPGVVNVQEK